MDQVFTDRYNWAQFTDAIQGADGVDYVDLIPGNGTARKILAAYGYHDDVAARDCNFALQQGAGLAMRDLNTVVSQAANIKQHLYSVAFFQEPLILRAGQTLRFNVGACGAGHFAYIVYTYEQMGGLDNYID